MQNSQESQKPQDSNTGLIGTVVLLAIPITIITLLVGVIKGLNSLIGKNDE